MFLLGDDARLVISASDLRTASACEFALVRELDVLLGRADRGRGGPRPDARPRQRARRPARAGRAAPAESRAPGRGPSPPVAHATRRDGLARAMAETLEALSSGARGAQPGDPVRRQLRRPRRLPREHPYGLAGQRHQARPARQRPGPAPGRRVRRPARGCRGARRPGGAVGPRRRGHPRLPARRGACRSTAAAEPASTASSASTARAASRRGGATTAGWRAGRAPVCVAEVEAARDLLLVAGMRRPTRRRLHDAGVTHHRRAGREHRPGARGAIARPSSGCVPRHGSSSPRRPTPRAGCVTRSSTSLR